MELSEFRRLRPNDVIMVRYPYRHSKWIGPLIVTRFSRNEETVYARWPFDGTVSQFRVIDSIKVVARGGETDET